MDFLIRAECVRSIFEALGTYGPQRQTVRIDDRYNISLSQAKCNHATNISETYATVHSQML